ncbi:hypothetical protein [Nitrosopumilus sp.]|uniref:helix-turn-helix transcriptional regulator n=1 Tax=Nitrosopumilus sp. TaxID=2024843 RepID=UPI0029317C06|nr:hypothetical protein [Nitrosopumilus sp.]
MDKEDETPVSDIFLELASETRCEILEILSEKRHRSTEISKKIGASIQETHRNTARMTETGLLVKDSDGFFNLTDYGRIITSQISYFEFFRQNRKFFEEHTVGKIPQKFIQRIGSLKNCQIISNVTIVLERLKKLESSAQKELKIMVNQAWNEEGKAIVACVKNGVKVRGILGKDTIFPKELIESAEKNISKLDPNMIEQRIIESVPISVYISHKEAGVIFPNLKGEVDMNVLIVSEDPEFRLWCEDIFEEYWSQGGRFRYDKTHII